MKCENGVRFGRLTVITELPPHRSPSGRSRRKVLCRCDCGIEKEVLCEALIAGYTTSCGCFKRENARRLYKKTNRYMSFGDCVVGYTAKNEPFVVDIEDYEKIKDYCWHVDHYGYLTARINGKLVKMHRLILDAPRDMVVDHINHNKKDNRKINIRVCTRQQNNINKQVKGWFWVAKTRKWVAYITINHKRINLGSFPNESKAIIARKKAEQKYFGEFACKKV